MSGLTRYLGPLAILARPARPADHGTAMVRGGARPCWASPSPSWARVALGRNWSGEITLKEDHELVTSGPYAAIRPPHLHRAHPAVLGLALFIASAGAWIGLALVVLSCWVKLRQEEALMLRQFPDAYPAYMARTQGPRAAAGLAHARAPQVDLIGSWALFFLVWTVMALGAKKDVHKQTIDEREPYTIPFVASLVLMLLPLHGRFARRMRAPAC